MKGKGVLSGFGGRLAEVLFAFLRQIDEEADTVGWHAGLVNYAEHRKAKSHERCLSDGLGELASENGFSAKREVRYGYDARKKCDIL